MSGPRRSGQTPLGRQASLEEGTTTLLPVCQHIHGCRCQTQECGQRPGGDAETQLLEDNRLESEAAKNNWEEREKEIEVLKETVERRREKKSDLEALRKGTEVLVAGRDTDGRSSGLETGPGGCARHGAT